MDSPRVLLADDHELVLDALKVLREPEFKVVGAEMDGRAVLSAALRLKPDLILLDISMPGLNGFEACRDIRAALLQAKIIFVSMHTDKTYLDAPFRSGGKGYVAKVAAATELIAAMRIVLKGGTYVSPRLAQGRQMDHSSLGSSASPQTADF